MSQIRLSVREKLRERACGCCEACGAVGATNAHHRLNRSQGGPDTLSNLLLLCGSGTTGCHGNVTEHPKCGQALGISVTLAQVGPVEKGKPITLANVPVWRWSRVRSRPEWVLLDDDGGITPELEG